MLKVALVTGASGGIGKAIAQKFIDNGYFVVGQYNSGRKSIDDFTKQLKLQGKSDYFFSIKADLSKTQDIEDMMENVLKSFKSIDVLVNNAGVSLTKLITDTTLIEWDKVFDVNVKSAYLITNKVLKGMISKQYGKIINVSSMWGLVGSSMEVCYSASKASLIGFTKALAKEVGPSNINVNCVCPGVIDTPMNAHLTQEDLSDIASETPLNRIGTPEEVADLVYFLGSEQSKFITGQVISCDGGFTV
ncbi:MAG: 3-oxoacyl-ACP reductase FabG [Clostridia bacterium]|nr:3-oxoacyl-ACP reductase FabG [Clostridia bacterium]